MANPTSPSANTQSEPALRLRLDREALRDNYRWLSHQSGRAVCGAAIKADGYGTGARRVLDVLTDEGCRDFFVATWAEAEALGPLPDSVALSVLHGVRPSDMGAAQTIRAKPVLSSLEQIQRWRDAGGGVCDIMVDTGMNRLGLDWRTVDSDCLNGLDVDTLMSHLASADEDVAQNEIQCARFDALRANLPARRYSLANSAGICLGAAYHADLTRPGLALYGGIARPEAVGHIRPVVFPEVEVLQRRTVVAGDSVGYNATYSAPSDMNIIIVNTGYADGYPRALSNHGGARFNGIALPLLGRVSMDLLAFAVPDGCGVQEGDWITLDFDPAQIAAQTGISQYEILTGLGQRFRRD